MTVASFVAAQRTDHGVPHAISCRALSLSESWFYKWRNRGPTPRQQRRDTLDDAVKRSFDASGGRYGSPRVLADLVEDGWRVSKKSVEASMARQGLVARPTRARRGFLTRPDKAAPPAPDLVKRDFTASAINHKWCGDLTEVPTGEGKLYLATVEDLASRRIVGFGLSEHHDAELATGALKMAVAVRGGDVAGTIFHSDRGSEGGFNWSSQHLDPGGVRWGRCGSGSVRFSCIGGRCRRRGGRRWRGVRIGSSSGRRSLLGSRPRMRRPRRVCHPRLGSGGSVMLAV
jgi:putative transposase